MKKRKQIKLTNFYEYVQNNSFGEYRSHEENGIGTTVIIEAVNAKHANFIAERKGLYFNGVRDEIDCPCCGDRWHEADSPSYSILPKWTWSDNCFVHFLDGKIFKLKGL